MRQRAMQLQWVTKTELEEFGYVVSCLCPSLKNKIWECNLHSSNVEEITHCKQNCFWKDILIEWAKIHFHEPQNGKEVRLQIVWYNSKIQFGNKILPFNKKLYDLGIFRLQDILDDNDRMCDMIALTQRYSSEVKTEWLWFKQVNHALPNLWKIMLGDTIYNTNDEHFDSACNYRKICNLKKPSAYVYNWMLTSMEVDMNVYG